MNAHDLKKLLPAHADDGTATHILAAIATTGLALSDGLALCEKEGGFRMVWGHDPVRNPVKSPPGGYLRVTRANYLRYKAYRRLGWGMQGCGHTQPTWYSLQDEADRIGGCWKPYPNLCVGFRHLHQLIAAHGREHGAAAYNGTGPAAEAYGRDFVHKQAAWHRKVT
jgi:hypothetical protein